MIAHVALAPDLPTPNNLYFGTSGALTLDFELMSSASAWCTFLGGKEQVPGENNGHRYFRDDYSIVWHGWQIYLTATEPVQSTRPADLPSDVVEALSAIVSTDQVAA